MCAIKLIGCWCVAAVLVSWPPGFVVRQPAVDGSEPGSAASEPVLSGPYTHKNLTVYLVHGADLLKGRRFLTLQEALEHEKLRVHETGNVNQLAVENLSSDQEIFIQAGEIVRGGRQDRVLGVDIIIEPRSGQIPIAAFCVEHGRWSARGGEVWYCFSDSDNSVNSNALKLAIQKEADQGVVWERVAVEQGRLSSSVGTAVADAESPTSLELSLESGAVKRTVDEYLQKLSDLIDDKDDVIGLVVAINGELYNADVYASPELFRKMWPKLLKAAATEAIAAQREGQEVRVPSLAEAQAFLVAAADGTASTREVPPRVRIVTRESSGHVMFETIDTKGGETWIHRSYIKK